MKCKIVAAGIEQNAAFDAAVDRMTAVRVSTFTQAGESGIASGALPANRRFGRCGRAGWHGIGNAIVGGADDAADRRRSIAQRRRAPDDLDLIGRERVDRHEMVLAEIGRAVAADAVLDDADAIDVEAADDRPA